MKNMLLIVESPTKAKMINTFLKGKFKVIASMGHVRDLPPRQLGVDIENNFQPDYKTMPGKEKVIKEIMSAVKASQDVYIATDFDREGEAIGWHIAELAGLDVTKVKRIIFHEITQAAIEEAVKNPRSLNLALVDAQQSRRILDRLVGYQISPILGAKIRKGLSAGRVQSVALELIVERENEIKNFKNQEYWTVSAALSKNQQKFDADLIAKANEKYHTTVPYKLFAEKYSVKITSIKTKESAEEIINKLKTSDYIVSAVKRSERLKNPPPPFMTSTLQREASNKLKFYASRTMSLAQKLYETGLITYMRTDSLDVAAVARKQAADFIQKNYGKDYLPAKPKVYKTKNKSAQEAHEAIRPTDILKTPETLKLDKDEQRLYELIWLRFVASQMSSAIMNTISVDIKAGDYIFRASGSAIKFDGYLKIYKDEENDTLLPDMTEGEKLKLESLLPKQHFTEPPPRYTEASLIKTLEENGIGRPSTYAPILLTLKNRGYVNIEKMKILPLEVAFVVIEMLKEYFKEILDLNFTAEMEKELDDIAEGNTDWHKVLKDFYVPFSKSLAHAKLNIKSVKQVIPTDEKCSKCGSPMVIRDGRFGKFMACSNFPKCRNTMSIDKDGKKIVPEKSDAVCEKCGKPMLIRNGRRGKFLACSGYPDCKNTKNISENKSEEK